MYFNRFDILSAYYLFGSLYQSSLRSSKASLHPGQGSKEYAYLSRAEKCGFKPGPNFRIESLSENGREIYDGLVQKEERRKFILQCLKVWGFSLKDLIA